MQCWNCHHNRRKSCTLQSKFTWIRVCGLFRKTVFLKIVYLALSGSMLLLTSTWVSPSGFSEHACFVYENGVGHDNITAHSRASNKTTQIHTQPSVLAEIHPACRPSDIFLSIVCIEVIHSFWFSNTDIWHSQRDLSLHLQKKLSLCDLCIFSQWIIHRDLFGLSFIGTRRRNS